MLKIQFMYLIVLGVKTLILGNRELCCGHRCHSNTFSLLYKGLPRDLSNGASSSVQLAAYTGNIGELE